MLVYIIYSITVLVATILGSCAGLGGGVIIKPIFDFIGIHDVSNISFLSTSSVFAMSVYSSVSQLKGNPKFNYKMAIFVAFGSVLGGIIGNEMFSHFIKIGSEQIVKLTQTSILILLLTGILVFENCNKRIKLQNKKSPIIIGFFLGVISTFLAIGGGPINVAVFAMLFSMNFKEATIYSLVTILFSQGSKLITIFATTGFAVYDYSLLFVLIPVALLGGCIGVKINKYASSLIVSKIYDATVVCIIFINIYNAIQAWLSI